MDSATSQMALFVNFKLVVSHVLVSNPTWEDPDYNDYCIDGLKSAPGESDICRNIFPFQPRTWDEEPKFTDQQDLQWAPLETETEWMWEFGRKGKAKGFCI